MNLEDINKALAIAHKELIRARSRDDQVNVDLWSVIEENLVNQKAKKLGLD